MYIHHHHQDGQCSRQQQRRRRQPRRRTTFKMTTAKTTTTTISRSVFILIWLVVFPIVGLAQQQEPTTQIVDPTNTNGTMTTPGNNGTNDNNNDNGASSFFTLAPTMMMTPQPPSTTTTTTTTTTPAPSDPIPVVGTINLELISTPRMLGANDVTTFLATTEAFLVLNLFYNDDDTVNIVQNRTDFDGDDNPTTTGDSSGPTAITAGPPLSVPLMADSGLSLKLIRQSRTILGDGGNNGGGRQRRELQQSQPQSSGPLYVRLQVSGMTSSTQPIKIIDMNMLLQRIFIERSQEYVQILRQSSIQSNSNMFVPSLTQVNVLLESTIGGSDSGSNSGGGNGGSSGGSAGGNNENVDPDDNGGSSNNSNNDSDNGETVGAGDDGEDKEEGIDGDSSNNNVDTNVEHEIPPTSAPAVAPTPQQEQQQQSQPTSAPVVVGNNDNSVMTNDNGDNTTSSDDSPLSQSAIIGIAVGGGCFLLVSLCCLYFFCCSRRRSVDKVINVGSEDRDMNGTDGGNQGSRWVFNPKREGQQPQQQQSVPKDDSLADQNLLQTGSSSTNKFGRDSESASDMTSDRGEEEEDLESQAMYSYNPRGDSGSVYTFNNNTITGNGSHSVMGNDNMSYAYSLEPGIEPSVVNGGHGNQYTNNVTYDNDSVNPSMYGTDDDLSQPSSHGQPRIPIREIPNLNVSVSQEKGTSPLASTSSASMSSGQNGTGGSGSGGKNKKNNSVTSGRRSYQYPADKNFAGTQIETTPSDLHLTPSEIAMLPSNLRSDDDEDNTTGSKNSGGRRSSNASSGKNVTRKIHAPSGKLGIVIDTTINGPVVHKVNDGSKLTGQIFPCDIIVAIDKVDTRAMSAADITSLMVKTATKQRTLTVRGTSKRPGSASDDDSC